MQPVVKEKGGGVIFPYRRLRGGYYRIKEQLTTVTDRRS